MSLAEYKKKRDFRATPEPVASEKPTGERRFVVQKHAATRLHFDFRLELGRTLKSWAIPKGLPLEKGEKRLAVQVEDHPLSYRTFEGTIPRGQYGGGTVMVWDVGTFTTEEPHPLKALAAGKLHLTLHGEKLSGSWHLVRLRGEERQWLIIRGAPESGARSSGRVPPAARDVSVLSGRTMAQIASGAPSRKNAAERTSPTTSKRKAPARKAPARKAPARKAPARKAPARKAPLALVAPMQALLVSEPPEGQWLYEVKLDGYRVVAYKQNESVKLLSRNGVDLTPRFPALAEALLSVDAERAIIDGELVALDRAGRPSFQRLHRPDGADAEDVFFYAFDLLQVDSEGLLTESLSERRTRLRRALKPCPDTVRFSTSLTGDVATMLTKARALGLEGLIGKREGSLYEPGRRSGAWIKLKFHNEQEFVIGGQTPPTGGRSHFGALLLGVYDGDELRYVGKVGAGFDNAALSDLHERLAPLARRASPFQDLLAGESAAALASVRWVDPELVCQVKFTEWTSAGRLRHPVFLGLRADKVPGDVTRERPQRAKPRRRR